MGESNMTAVRGLPERNARTHILLARQTAGGHKGVIAGIDHQRRDANAV